MPHESANDYKRSHNGPEPRQLEARLEHTRAEIDETLAAIEHKLTPGELVDETIDFLRTHGPGPFITDLAEELKERPLPAALSAVGAAWATKQAAHMAGVLARKPLPTAVTVLGLAWFMMSESRTRRSDYDESEHWMPYGGSPDEEPSERLRRFGRTLKTGAERVASSTAGAIERMRERTASSAAAAGHATEELGERAGHSASTAVHRLEETASHVRESAAAAASTIKHAASEALGTTREAARTAVESSERMAHSAREYTVRGKERTMEAASELEDTIRRHPLVTAMVLATVGGVVAAMLPTTRREDELLGPKREELKNAAYDTAREQLERGKRVAGAAMEGAVEGARERAAEVAEEEGFKGSGSSGSGM